MSEMSGRGLGGPGRDWRWTCFGGEEPLDSGWKEEKTLGESGEEEKGSWWGREDALLYLRVPVNLGGKQ